MVVEFNDDMLAELYRMEFDFESNQARLVERPKAAPES